MRLGIAPVWLAGGLVILAGRAGHAWATPEFVEHVPANQVFGEPPDTTMREPLVPREDEPTQLWIKIGYSFFYTDVALYYTTNGADPTGSFGAPGPSTSVLRSSTNAIQFVRNEGSPGGNIDWWRAILPQHLREYGVNFRYRLSAWHSGGGAEIFGNNYGCSDNTCNDPLAPPATHAYTVKLAWPGRGSPLPNPGEGYPPVHFWKEEGIIGNGYINAMLDRNGTYYDVHYPGAGGVYGVGTRNEGYNGGLDTFPPFTSGRGQMHLNQCQAGIRFAGTTYWLSNQAGGDYKNVSQSYISETQTLRGTADLVANGAMLHIEQLDFSPRGVAFPVDQNGVVRRGIVIKRMLITNNGGGPREINVYLHGDFAINGGDGYDAMAWDGGRGTMIAYDRAGGTANSRGEYNITTFADYPKEVSVYLAASMKQLGGPGLTGGQPATDSWRDSSGDHDQGWIGLKMFIAPTQTKEVDIAIIGGFDNFREAQGTYAVQMVPLVEWFQGGNALQMQTATDSHWRNWLNDGVTVDTPDAAYDELFKRGLLATALHVDELGGGVIAGFHNGAYPFVWPRDAVYAAISFARTGHLFESANVYRFLREVCYRDGEPWGRPGFWKQKYTTDGYTVWGAPQVDETAAVPWGVHYHHQITGDIGFLNQNYVMCYDAGLAMTTTSGIDPGRLHLEPAYPGAPGGQELMYSNNVWEDSYAPFVYSNAAILRALRDLDQVATTLGYGNDAAFFLDKATHWNTALRGRVAWDGENTDISLLGVSYPFDVMAANDPLVSHMLDRINGVASDRFGQNHPLMNFPGAPNGWEGLLNRYWGDGYWNGGPWFLNTLWYGCYYAKRQDLTPGKADIDNHKYRLDRCIAHNGPLGFGAEQMSPDNSLLYPGETDFRLQTAWPNAWESMSTYVDGIMMFLGMTPRGTDNVLQIEPKLPSQWSTMTFRNVPANGRKISVRCDEGASVNAHMFVNESGGGVGIDTYVRVPAGDAVFGATVDGAPAAHQYDAAAGRVRVTGQITAAAGGSTVVSIHHGLVGDFDADGMVDTDDLPDLVAVLLEHQTNPIHISRADMNRDGAADGADVQLFVNALLGA